MRSRARNQPVRLLRCTIVWTEHSERRAVIHPELLREPAERLKPSLEIMRLDYDGAEVRSPEPLTWRQVAPALPKQGTAPGLWPERFLRDGCVTYSMTPFTHVCLDS